MGLKILGVSKHGPLLTYSGWHTARKVESVELAKHTGGNRDSRIVRSHLGKLFATRLYRKRVDDEQKRLERENKVVDVEQQKEQAKLLAFFNIPGGKREIRKEVRAIKMERKKGRRGIRFVEPLYEKGLTLKRYSNDLMLIIVVVLMLLNLGL